MQIIETKGIERPKVGVGVAVCQNGRVLFGKRLNAHGEGTWSFPGGHLEYGESFKDTAKREVFEETGLEIRDVRLLHVTNDCFFQEQKHYITVFMQAQTSGRPEIKEPDKMIEWAWFRWENLPEPLFLPMQNLLKDGVRPFGI